MTPKQFQKLVEKDIERILKLDKDASRVLSDKYKVQNYTPSRHVQMHRVN
jgi:hypothetical protein